MTICWHFNWKYFVKTPAALGATHKPRGQIFEYFWPASPFEDRFTKKCLSMNMVILLSPPPQLPTWFMDTPLKRNTCVFQIGKSVKHHLPFWDISFTENYAAGTRMSYHIRNFKRNITRKVLLCFKYYRKKYSGRRHCNL